MLFVDFLRRYLVLMSLAVPLRTSTELKIKKSMMIAQTTNPTLNFTGTSYTKGVKQRMVYMTSITTTSLNISTRFC